MKVILIDVFQTKEGQKYLSSCGGDAYERMQSPRERRSERRHSTEHSTVRRRASASRKDQTKSSLLKTANPPSSKTTDTVCAEENDVHLSKEVQSPAAKRCKRLNDSLKQAGQAVSDEEESCSLEENNKSEGLLPRHTESPDTVDSELCPVEESVSPLHSEEADSEQTSESLITATHTPTQVKQPSIFHRTGYQCTESEDPTQVRFPNNV